MLGALIRRGRKIKLNNGVDLFGFGDELLSACMVLQGTQEAVVT